MKTKTILATLTLCVALIFSCKKEKKTETNNSNNNSTPNPPSVVASWKYSQLYYSNDSGVTWNLDGAPVPPDILTFASNGTYICPTRDFTRLGQPSSNVSDNGSYTNTDSLAINSSVSNKTLKTKVVKLSDTELWLRYSCKCYEVHFTKN